MLLAMMSLSSCSPRRSVEALDLLRDIAAGEAPSALKRNTAEPIRHAITYVVAGKRYLGDIYRPGVGQAKAAAVFVPGVVEDGKDDSRFVAFAKSFARMGFLVLVPEIPNLRTFVISASDSRVIADAVRHLAAAGGFEDKRSIGLFAFSYAAGPTLIASLEPDTRYLLHFIYVVGPYYNVESVITYFTTGHFRLRPDQRWSTGHPNPYAQWVFLRSNAGKLEDPNDRAILIAIAGRKFADVNAEIADLTARLGPQGHSVYALFTNRDPDRVHDLIGNLPAPILGEMNALDLSRRDLSSLQARLVIMHGRTDTMIPFTESMALAQAVHGSADLYVLNSLSHIELELSGARDFYKLWNVAYVILAQRDRMPKPHYAEIAKATQWRLDALDAHFEIR
jgi:pimeloyl-ACP methyl ester carboxylesterase